MRALQEAVERPVDSKEEEPPFLPLYAMFLLAQFRERRAYRLIIDLCRLPREGLDSLIGDTITEGLTKKDCSGRDTCNRRRSKRSSQWQKKRS